MDNESATSLFGLITLDRAPPEIVATNCNSVTLTDVVEMAHNDPCGSHLDLLGSYRPIALWMFDRQEVAYFVLMLTVAVEYALGHHESLKVWFFVRLFPVPLLRHS